MLGISISILTGENGILNQATNAKLQTDEAHLKEKIELAVSTARMGENGLQDLTTDNLFTELNKNNIDSIISENSDGSKKILLISEKREYKLYNNGNLEKQNIDFNTKYTAPSSQVEERNKDVIGIGTDGNPVNMDLWEYTLLENGTYGLNSKEVYNNKEYGGTNETKVMKKAYLGDYNQDGTILGVLPQFIKPKDSLKFVPVTSLYGTFYNDIDLKISPKIPETVTELWATFIRTNLTEAPYIVKNVKNMRSTFHGCSNLQNVSIGENVINLAHTFRECKSLHNIILKIPNTVIDMESTFRESGLKNCQIFIPNSVENLQATFAYCQNLNGNIVINANINGKMIGTAPDYHGCLYQVCLNAEDTLYLSGSCLYLQNIYNTKSNNSNILLSN